MSDADRVRLLHMLEAAEEAVTIGQDHSRTSLLAVMKDIEIIGEAANKVGDSLRAAEPDVPWLRHSRKVTRVCSPEVTHQSGAETCRWRGAKAAANGARERPPGTTSAGYNDLRAFGADEIAVLIFSFSCPWARLVLCVGHSIRAQVGHSSWVPTCPGGIWSECATG